MHIYLIFLSALNLPWPNQSLATASSSQCLSTRNECECQLVDTHSLITSILDYNLTPSNRVILYQALTTQIHQNEYDSNRPAHFSLKLGCHNQSLTDIPSFKRLGYSRQPTTNYLDLSFNSIHEITSGIFNGLLINSIDLSKNQLRTTNLNSLNGIIKILTVIKLNNNQLTHETLFANLFISKLTRLRVLLVASNILEFILDNSLPVNVRSTIQIVDFKSNRITFISDQAFSDCPSLTYLNLDENLLANNTLKSNKTLHLGFLHHLPSLESLLLSSNNLQHIRGGFRNFARSGQLRLLNLNKNSLRTLTSLFCQKKQPTGLTNLRILHFSSNKINQISSEDLNCLHNLQELHLSDNNIKFINLGSFEGLSNLKELKINKNPLIPYPDMFRGVQRSLKHLFISFGTHFYKRFDKALEVLVLDSGMVNLETLDMSGSVFEVFLIHYFFYTYLR